MKVNVGMQELRLPHNTAYRIFKYPPLVIHMASDESLSLFTVYQDQNKDHDQDKDQDQDKVQDKL